MTTSPRRSGARTRSVRTSVAAPVLAVLLAAGLAACGDEEPDSASDPESTSTATETPTETPTLPEDDGTGSAGPIEATGSAGVTEATLVTATDVGGQASTLAFALDSDQARTDFAGQFERGFGDVVLSELEASASVAGSTPYGAVAAVGCDAPESVAIEAGEAGFEVTPVIPKKTVQCFAPMTFVVLFAAPNA